MATVAAVDVALRAPKDGLQRDLGEGARLFGDFGNRVGASLGGLGGSIVALNQGLQLGATLIRGIAGPVATLGRATVGAAAEVENLRVRLVNLLQDEQAATAEYTRLARVASTTPFQLRNVVQAGVTLRAFGETNSSAAKAVADLAAFMGTDIVEAAQSYGRAFAAGAGAADVLRDRGVLALVATRAGVDDLTKLSLPEFRRVLFEAMVDPVGPIAGSTTRLAATWDGAIANIQDSTFNLKASLGEIVTTSEPVRDLLLRLRERIDRTAAAVVDWSKNNQDLIDQRLGAFLGGLSQRAEDLVDQLPALIENTAALAVSIGQIGSATASALPDLETLAGTLRDVATAYASLPDEVRTGLLAGGATFALTRNPALAAGVGAGAAINAADRFDDSIQAQVNRRLSARGLTADQLSSILEARSSDVSLGGDEIFLGAAGVPDHHGAPPQPASAPAAAATPAAAAARSSGRDRSPQEIGRTALQQVAADQARLAAAAETRIRGEIDLLRERGDETGRVEALEARILELRRTSLASQIALTRAADGYTTEVAQLSAEYEVVAARIGATTGPTVEVADEFERAAVAAERLGTTLQQDVLASVREMVVGLGRGTTTLDRFGEQLVSTTTGNVIGRLFDEAIGEGGIFGPGTGAGAGAAERSFATRIASVFGAEASSNAPPEGLTGPPEPMGAMGELGQAGAVGLAAGSTAVNLARLFGVKETAGVGAGAGVGAAAGMAFGGPLGAAIGAVGGGLIGGLVEGAFRPRETGGQRGRRALNDLFRDAGLVATRALSKRNRGAIAALDAPGFFGAVESDLLALGGVLGLDDNAARQGAGSLGQRATLLGLTQEQVQAEAERAARRSGVSIEEAVGDLNVSFADFQGRGRDASMTQDEYNRRLQSTVRLLVSDLPAGVDASVVALGSLEQFGEVSIANLDDLERALNSTAAAASGLAAGVSAGIAAARKTGDVQDLSRFLADAFIDTFTDQVTTDLIESGLLSGSLTEAVGLQREIAEAFAVGDLDRAAQLQGQLSATFADASSTLMQAAGPLVQSLRGFEASIGIQTTSGVISQAPPGGMVPPPLSISSGPPTGPSARTLSSSASLPPTAPMMLESALAATGISGVAGDNAAEVTVVVQNILDGRVIEESRHNIGRLQRRGTVKPQQVGTKKKDGGE